MRCNGNDELQDSAPCNNCLSTINELNIKRIVFSSKNNEFVSTDPKTLEINHTTTGNKFIKHKTQHKTQHKTENKTENKTQNKTQNKREN